MSLTADEVVVKLRADLADYDRKITASTRLTEEGFNRIGKASDDVARSVKLASNSIVAALAGVSLKALASDLAELADAAKSMDVQLKLATAGFGSFAQAQADAARIADATRSGIEETAALYGNFLRAAREAGKSQGEAARATESFSKALKIGGASAAEAASATLQFGQALASGVLRGDEFNSIMEASPRIARLLADSLNVPIGQLRKLAEEGKLTRDVLFDALLDGRVTAPLDAEFRELPVTFGDAMTAIRNAALTTFGAFDRGGQFSTALANFINAGGEGFADLASAAEQFGQETRAILDGLRTAFQPLLEAGTSVFNALGIKAQSLGETIHRFIGFNLRNTQATLNALVSPVGSLLGYKPFTFADNFEASYQQSLHDARVRQAAQARKDFFDAIGLNGDRNRYLGLPSAPASSSASSAKPKVKTSRGRAKAAEPTMAELIEKSIANITPEDLDRVQRAADEATRRLYQSIGIDPQKALADALYGAESKQADRDRSTKAAEDAAQAFRSRMENQIHTLADIYENAFSRGTKGIWNDFKQIGTRIIAEVLARFTMAQIGGGGFNLGSALGTAVSNVLPGFAGGGSGTIGGRGGTDNNVLSLNGKPFANVSRGERLSIENRALSGRASQSQSVTVYVQANDYFDARVGRVAGPVAAKVITQAAPTIMSQAAGIALKATPARLAQYQTNGT